MKKLLVLLLIWVGCIPVRSIENSGRLRVVMSINSQELLQFLSNPNYQYPYFQEALQLASVRQETSKKNYVDLFVEEFRKLDDETPLAIFFSFFELRKYITPESADSEVISVLKQELEKTTTNSFQILRARVELFGIDSANIQYMETPGHILVELPDVREPERVLQLLRSTSNLEFWNTYWCGEIMFFLEEVNEYLLSTGKEQNDLFSLLQVPDTDGLVVGYAYEKDIEQLNRYFSMPEVKQILPRALIFKWGAKSVSEDAPIFPLYAIKITNRFQKAPINGEVIIDANAQEVEPGISVIIMMMNSEGTEMWARLTRENIGQSIAIVIDDRVFSAPTIMDEITGGHAQISGQLTLEEAKDLAISLKSGRMPFSLTIVKEEMVPRR